MSQASFLFITGDTLRPDLLLHLQSNYLCIVELTVGFESNIVKNDNPKRLGSLELVKQLMEKYKQVKFVNLSISALGLFDKTSSDLLK